MLELFSKRAGNEALTVNPPDSFIDIHITKHGSDWLWACFALFSAFTIFHAAVFLFTSSKRTPFRKAILAIPFFINLVLAFAYYTYASDLGYTGIETEFRHVSTSEGLYVRQIFYSKFIAWFVSWPLVMVLYEINLTDSTDTDKQTAAVTDEEQYSEADGKTAGDLFVKLLTFLQGFFSKFLAVEVWVLGLLIGALIRSTYKWGYFTFAVFAQLLTMAMLIKSIITSSAGTSSNKKLGRALIGFQLVVWLLQSVNWGLSEGGNVIQPDSEAVFAGVLDIVTFALIPTIITYINISSIDEQFFHKFGFRPRGFKRSNNEKIPETPRHSGDTAVPSNPNDTTEAAQAEETV